MWPADRNLKTQRRTTVSTLSAALKGLEILQGIQAQSRITSIVRSGNKVKLIALAFDATGSMEPIWSEAKHNIQKLVLRLREITPEAKLGLVAYRDHDHGDKMLEFFGPSSNVEAIYTFLNSVECIGGETTAEAVEVALEELLELGPSMAILVGDAPPHGVIDELVDGKDFREFAGQLGGQNVPVYTVATNEDPGLISSFGSIAELSGGKAFHLDQVDDLIDLLSVATAKRVGELGKLSEILKRENGGQVTPRQRILLLQAGKS